MRRTFMLAALLAAGLLAGCSDSQDETTSSTVPDPAPRVDTDPTPPSGTGGETQAIAPDGTSNGVPTQSAPQQ